EMLSAFDEACAERRVHGRRAYAAFVTRELAGLLLGAAFEWLAKLTSDPSRRGRSLPDRVLMRPPGVSWDDYYGPFPRLPAEVSDARHRADVLVQHMVHAIAHHDFEGARRYSDQEREARLHLRNLQDRYGIGDDSDPLQCS
ncbi:MAG TPA: hypothetical protein VFW44_03385, partial [Bryobacteraceae bacterium]|nr:hypothetical protein [Bryobacteraceae bacterium]